MLAKLPNNAAILIAAISGRSLAAAARRAGLRPLVADLFNDADTVRLAERATRLSGSIQAGIDPHRLVETLRSLAEGHEPIALVYGSGFERKPDAIEAVAKEFVVAGNTAQAIRQIKDPANLSRLCLELGISHPEISTEAPSEFAGWLTKIGGGAGGSHVKPASGDVAGDGRYFQRFVTGRNLSALFVANGTSARIVGFSRQWSSPHPGAPFRYGGAVRLRRYDRARTTQIATWLTALTQRVRLVGLCSADFIASDRDLSLIEINPRPGATLDIFDSEATPLLLQHLRAVSGATISVPAYGGSVASAIAYTRKPIKAFPPIAWPAMTADHQTSGTALDAGDPVCTVFATAHSASAAERAVKSRVKALAIHWEEGFA